MVVGDFNLAVAVGKRRALCTWYEIISPSTNEGHA